MRVLHEIEQRSAKHQIQLIENQIRRRDRGLVEYGPAHSRPHQDTDVKAYGGEDEESAKLREEPQHEAAIEAHFDLRCKIPEDQARHDSGRNAAQWNCI